MLPIDGGCRCARLRIRVTEAPIMTAACHCFGCRRMSSSAFSLTAMWLASAFAVTNGEPVIGGLHGNDVRHFFCGPLHRLRQDPTADAAALDTLEAVAIRGRLYLRADLDAALRRYLD